MYTNMFHVLTDIDLGRACFAMYDDDEEQYAVYNSPEWLQADFIGQAISVNGCKQVAREYFNELKQG